MLKSPADLAFSGRMMGQKPLPGSELTTRMLVTEPGGILLKISSIDGKAGGGEVEGMGYRILNRSCCVSGSDSQYAGAGSGAFENFMQSFFKSSMTVALINSLDLNSSTTDFGNTV